MTLFKNKYRVESARKPDWNYSDAGWYFVTICTMDKRPYLGRVTDERLCLFSLGEYAQRCWLEIPNHYNDVVLDEFIVMPNHIHGIVVIKPDPDVKAREAGNLQNRARPQGRATLGSIIGSFKSEVTRWSGQQKVEFAWQSRFHDRIIRSEKALEKIRKYIQDNPMNWGKDIYSV